MWDHRRILPEEFAPFSLIQKFQLIERLAGCWLAVYCHVTTCNVARSGIGWGKSFGSAASLRETLFRQEWNKYDHLQLIHIQLYSSPKKSLCDKFVKLPYSKNPNSFFMFPLPFSTEQQNHQPGRSCQKTKHCQSFADIHFWLLPDSQLGWRRAGDRENVEKEKKRNQFKARS